MPTYETPGVYVEEVATLPASVAEVASAIPAFVGYTEKSVTEPKRIRSMVEFEELFGGPLPTITVNLDGSDRFSGIHTADLEFHLFYSLQFYFSNGGGPCYISSAGTFGSANLSSNAQIVTALESLAKEDEPTLLVLTDGTSLDTADYYAAISLALQQCSELKDRFTLIDVVSAISTGATDAEDLRDATVGLGNNHLKYGAAYYPYLETTLTYPDSAVNFIGGTTLFNGMNLAEGRLLAQENTVNGEAAAKVMSAILNGVDAERALHPIVLPPSAAMAGVYATVDRERGVWKAPANVSVNAVVQPTIAVNDDTQAGLNVDTTGGKSINVIREFPNKGSIVWGARTLAGNDNEWRYVPVRRLFLVVEESIQKSTGHFVFEPNDAGTWTKLKAMIENYLTRLWREGGLAGANPEQAFFVNVGLGSTMTSADILEGKLIVEVGMAAVRPAEFVILRFSHILQQG